MLLVLVVVYWWYMDIRAAWQVARVREIDFFCFGGLGIRGIGDWGLGIGCWGGGFWG